MSSLIASASPWNNDINDSVTRKRIPTMRKTVKLRPYAGDIISQADVSETIESMTTIDDVNTINDSRANRVNELINQMSNVTPDNDGNNLSDFKPPPMPESNNRMDMQQPSVSDIRDDSSIKIPKPMSNPFINTKALDELNSYQTVYEKQSTPLQSYYTNMNSGNIPAINSYDNRITEKINYMIHLLEAQESERTANVTEEFILYTFLGVFMIYICDSFSRGGRYVR